MGLAYTIDTPIKVARFGISSVMSIIEDNLVEKMREHYYRLRGEAYHPISAREPDYRAKRITDYLNLVHRIVDEQLAVLREEPFIEGSEIMKYFEMMPSHHRLHQLFQTMMHCTDNAKRQRLDHYLRAQVVPGSIDVNIMTKLDKVKYRNNEKLSNEFNDAHAALRGYAQSNLRS
ncbi:MAG TPA: hypothetical protein DGG95_14640, partial [Cytophagales bacterium]|nr:hypothetical protein [Cytophagales bacterium]